MMAEDLLDNEGSKSLRYDSFSEESDTIEPEVLSSEELTSLLLPPSSCSNASSIRIPDMYRSFSITYSNDLLQNWVKQPSPCCAAACIASAINALGEYGRNNIITIPKVISIYCELVAIRIEKKKKSMERLLMESIEPLDQVIQDKLKEQGMMFGGKGQQAVKKSALIKCIQNLIDDTSNPLPVLHQLRLCETIKETDLCQNDMGYLSDEDVDKETLQPLHSKNWDIVERLYQYYHNMDGLAKLRNPKPATSICGNWALLSAVSRISDDNETVSYKSCSFLGKKSKCNRLEIPLLSNDDIHAINSQWYKLWEVFNRDQCVIIYHLRNHYALVYALREWVDSDNIKRREVLTSRKGQRPSSWISWNEVRETVLKWSGHKMMYIQKFNSE